MAGASPSERPEGRPHTTEVPERCDGTPDGGVPTPPGNVPGLRSPAGPRKGGSAAEAQQGRGQRTPVKLRRAGLGRRPLLDNRTLFRQEVSRL